jgi:ATP-GRASP peptide maturase of grasp-with-spasm system
MIFISTSADDYSTFKVIRWLKYLKKDFVVVNTLNEMVIKSICLSNEKTDINVGFTKDKKSLNFNAITSYWYRRGSLINTLEPFEFNEMDPQLKKEVVATVNAERLTYRHYFDNFLSSFANNINKFEDNNTNKLISLQAAKDCGILIPETYILTKKSDLERVLQTRKLIVKNSSQGAVFAETYFEGLVKKFDHIDLENTPDSFAPTLFQVLINKKYEIRSFMLKNTFFSSVIFSQNDPRTAIDFRNYNNKRPNRVSPFILPEEIEKKLLKLSEKLNLNSGSFDLLVDKENRIYFLEVNPIGQFGQVSRPCNYNVEKVIAENL